jgi:hypothetical protein
MHPEVFLNNFLSPHPLVISYICSLLVHVTMPENSGGKEEEMKEKNAKSRPIGRNSRRFIRRPGLYHCAPHSSPTHFSPPPPSRCTLPRCTLHAPVRFPRMPHRCCESASASARFRKLPVCPCLPAPSVGPPDQDVKATLFALHHPNRRSCPPSA